MINPLDAISPDGAKLQLEVEGNSLKLTPTFPGACNLAGCVPLATFRILVTKGLRDARIKGKGVRSLTIWKDGSVHLRFNGHDVEMIVPRLALRAFVESLDH